MTHDVPATMTIRASHLTVADSSCQGRSLSNRERPLDGFEVLKGSTKTTRDPGRALLTTDVDVIPMRFGERDVDEFVELLIGIRHPHLAEALVSVVGDAAVIVPLAHLTVIVKSVLHRLVRPKIRQELRVSSVVPRDEGSQRVEILGRMFLKQGGHAG